MFLTQPIIFPASGQNYIIDSTGEPSLAWAILLSNGLFIPLVTIAIALRIFTKLSIAKKLFLDDCKYPMSVLRNRQRYTDKGC